VLTGLEGPDDRMSLIMGVLACMAIGGRIAAADMPAGQTDPKVHPATPYLQAFLAALRRSWGNFADLIEVCTLGPAHRPTRPVNSFFISHLLHMGSLMLRLFRRNEMNPSDPWI
jgi:hypothetical protein